MRLVTSGKYTLTLPTVPLHSKYRSLGMYLCSKHLSSLIERQFGTCNSQWEGESKHFRFTRHQGRSQDFGSGGRGAQTKFPLRTQEFRFEAVTFKKIYSAKTFKNFENLY